MNRVEEIATPIQYTATGTAIVAGLTLTEWLAIVSIIVAIGTFCINWWYKHKQYKLLLKENT